MSYLNGTSLSSHVVRATEAASGPAGTEPGTKQTQDIVKTVYINGEASLKAVALHVMHAADATLGLVASMVVHLVIRNYHSIDAERRDFKQTKAELLSAFQEFAEAKRGKPFEHAWLSKLLNVSVAFGRSLLTDYDKKGVTGPIVDVLRARSPDKAIEFIMTLMKQKTKGSSSFTVLEKAMAAKKPVPRQAPNQTAAGKNGGRGSNATKASTDKPERIAKSIEGEKGHDIINAMSGSAKAKAITLANKVGNSNVDHTVFVMRSIGFLTTAKDCLAVSNAALERLKVIEAETIKKPVRAKKKAQPDAQVEAA